MPAQKAVLVEGIKAVFRAAHKTRAVVGLSGGIDSAVAAALLVEALGKENVCCLLLPSATSDMAHVEDARTFAKHLGVVHYIQPINQFAKLYEKLPWKESKLAAANTQARVRATLLYNYANTHDALVAGTGNRTELELGYFTKHGDGAVDFLPLGGLWKRQVRELAKELGVPGKIISKKPTADLWPVQTDEAEMGLTYEEADAILSALLDEKKTPAQVVQAGRDKAIVEKIVQRREANRHKTAPPPVISAE